MIYGAEINENGVVIRVVCAESLSWLSSTLGGIWIETWEGGGSRKNYAGIGFTYEATRDAFIPPKPYSSWVLTEATCRWEAPVQVPPGGPWVWDESTQDWVAA